MKCRTSVWPLILTLTCASHATAQADSKTSNAAAASESRESPTATSGDTSAADSVVVARAAWARAGAALRAQNGDIALKEIARAHHAWPTQPAYVWGHAIVALQLNDTATVRAALADYAALGIGR